MATALRPWICSLAEKELLDAYNHHVRNRYSPGANIKDGNRLYSPKSITVTRLKQKLVQIKEVSPLSFHEGVEG
jgi:hypothetical protein